MTVAICWGSTTAGCIPFAGREFRTVAGPAFQSGVTQIVNGVLDGLFAVVEVDTTTDSSTN